MLQKDISLVWWCREGWFVEWRWWIDCCGLRWGELYKISPLQTMICYSKERFRLFLSPISFSQFLLGIKTLSVVTWMSDFSLKRTWYLSALAFSYQWNILIRYLRLGLNYLLYYVSYYPDNKYCYYQCH